MKQERALHIKRSKEETYQNGRVLRHMVLARKVKVALDTNELLALKGKDFLRTQDVNAKQTLKLFELAGVLKTMHTEGFEMFPLLFQKNIALLFEKPSTRTRVSFDNGISLLGGHATFIEKQSTQMGRGEDWRDTASTLAQYCDAIMARVFPHKEVDAFARYVDVPIINGLTDEDHPCQILSDLFTIHEHFGKLDGLTLMYSGVSDNVTDSLLVGCAMMGVNMVVATPAPFPVSKKYLSIAQKLAKKTGAHIRVFHEMPDAKTLKKVNVVYTDEWESMHMHLDKKKLLPILSKFQVNEKLLAKCATGAKMMHCLPALKGEEVNSTIMYGKSSLVWTQAKNRMYVQMALLSAIVRN